MSSWATAAEDTLRSYANRRRSPFPTEASGRFGPMDTPRDDEIDFDFFEDDATQEAQSTQRARLTRRNGGGGGRGPRRGSPFGAPPRGAAPLLRLLALVAFVIFLVLVLALVVQSCASQSKHDAY